MAYNRNNKNLLIRDVQETYLRHKEVDVPNTRIYREHIYPVYRISIRTFYNYLAIPVLKLIREQNQQLSLFN